MLSIRQSMYWVKKWSKAEKKWICSKYCLLMKTFVAFFKFLILMKIFLCEMLDNSVAISMLFKKWRRSYQATIKMSTNPNVFILLWLGSLSPDARKDAICPIIGRYIQPTEHLRCCDCFGVHSIFYWNNHRSAFKDTFSEIQTYLFVIYVIIMYILLYYN